MSVFRIIIPAYNAEQTLGRLLQKVQGLCVLSRVIVVDDGSADATSSIAAAAGADVCSHGINRGKGAALRTGIERALRRECDAVITMDADLQHDPVCIPSFMDAFDTGRYDVIVGNRLNDLRGMPAHRIISNLMTTGLVGLRTGANIADSQCGFRCIGRRVLEQVTTHSPGFEAETEFIIRAAMAGFRFGSVPIPTVYAGEKSSMTHWDTTVNFVRVLLKEY
ncbi:MAG: glycosyltransferase family 2 protein [Ignavibacteriales bacterium]|nr:glycosyltransferase family 2 protein [Ignavibacteriales bacterium]